MSLWESIPAARAGGVCPLSSALGRAGLRLVLAVQEGRAGMGILPLLDFWQIGSVVRIHALSHAWAASCSY